MLLGAIALASVAVGAKSLALSTVIDAFTDYDGSLNGHLIVRDLRLPRTELGLLVGPALGLAGALMQGVTRNPIADPGLLGVNAGAAVMVVIGIYVLRRRRPLRVRVVRVRRRFRGVGGRVRDRRRRAARAPRRSSSPWPAPPSARC